MTSSTSSVSTKAQTVAMNGYLITLLLIACLSLFAYVMMHKATAALQHRAGVINVSGRQRMLSQHLALSSSSFVQAPMSEKFRLKFELLALIQSFEDAHRELISATSKFGKPSPKLKEVYFSKEINLNGDVEELIKDVRLLLSIDEKYTSKRQATLERIRLSARDVILPKLDRVVAVNQTESEAEVARLQKIESFILLFTLLLLLVAAICIFQPLANITRRLLKAGTAAEAMVIKVAEAKTAYLHTMGGEIAFDSGTNKESNLDFNIPSQLMDLSPIEQNSQRFSATILLVEDNEVNQEVLITQLKKMGLLVDVAQNGEEAVIAADGHIYDLILMDCEMPIMDGFAATREIRNIENQLKRERVPILAMTGHSSEEIRQMCMEAGMDAFTSKPIRLEVLSGILRPFLQEKLKAVKVA